MKSFWNLYFIYNKNKEISINFIDLNNKIYKKLIFVFLKNKIILFWILNYF